MHISSLVWFTLAIVFLITLDLIIFHRKAHTITAKEASFWTCFWIALALMFNGYIYYEKGLEPALSFLTGYIIELSLSVDNLFVFLLVFKYFQTPAHTLHKVLFWGILGAIVFRALFIWLGITLISQFHWVIYLFGFFLIVTGIKFWREKEKEFRPQKNPILRIFKHYFPVTEEYIGSAFFVFRNGVRYATPLFVVLLVVETTDIIFAIDSVPAILSITSDPFIVYTSNIFAILGLRSLYFVLSHLMGLFHYLHYGLSVLLVFIGLKMCLSEVYPIPTFLALGFVFFVLSVSVVLSLILPKRPS